MEGISLDVSAVSRGGEPFPLQRLVMCPARIAMFKWVCKQPSDARAYALADLDDYELVMAFTSMPNASTLEQRTATMRALQRNDETHAVVRYVRDDERMREHLALATYLQAQFNSPLGRLPDVFFIMLNIHMTGDMRSLQNNEQKAVEWFRGVWVSESRAPYGSDTYRESLILAFAMYVKPRLRRRDLYLSIYTPRWADEARAGTSAINRPPKVKTKVSYALLQIWSAVQDFSQQVAAHGDWAISRERGFQIWTKAAKREWAERSGAPYRNRIVHSDDDMYRYFVEFCHGKLAAEAFQVVTSYQRKERGRPRMLFLLVIRMVQDAIFRAHQGTATPTQEDWANSKLHFISLPVKREEAPTYRSTFDFLEAFVAAGAKRARFLE